MRRALARDPAHRYADAAEMEDALRDGLAGVAPSHRAMLDPTRDAARRPDATRMLTGTRTGACRRPRRRLQPIDEEPRPSAARPAARRGAARPQQGGGAGKWIALVLVILVVIAGGIVAYETVGPEPEDRADQRRTCSGNLDDSVQSFKDLVDDNTQ